MSGLDEKGARYGCICPHHGLQGMFARTKIALVASCMVATHRSKLAAQQCIGNSASVASAIVGDNAKGHAIALRAPCKEWPAGPALYIYI